MNDPLDDIPDEEFRDSVREVLIWKCLELLVKKTTERELLEVAQGSNSAIKEAIARYNRYEEHGWPAGILALLYRVNVPSEKFNQIIDRTATDLSEYK